MACGCTGDGKSMLKMTLPANVGTPGGEYKAPASSSPSDELRALLQQRLMEARAARKAR